eukprot:NODE_193_length_15440_cov_0.478587.p11 type:complete len:104 gc:universal NODE_193_length_15440_cov_0.478587:9793-9482(-)
MIKISLRRSIIFLNKSFIANLYAFLYNYMTFPDFSNSLNTRCSSFSQMMYGINGCNPEYVKSKEITSRYSIHSSTLRSWSKHGRIRFLLMPRRDICTIYSRNA